MSEKPQDEQLSGKVVCATWPVTPHLLDGHPCSDPRHAQPQAPARRHEGECADERRGLYGKYIIQRADGSDASGGKHAGCQYFVLDLTHDNYALPALREYARWCRGQFPLLADDLDALRTGNKAFDLTAQAPAPSLDARAALREIFLEAGFLTNDPQASRRAIRELAEAALAAPPSPSDALRDSLERALKTLSKWKAAWSERDRHTAIRMRVEASDETRDLMELDPAALAASPSVTREQELNAAWIKGCLAGREEAAALVDRESQARVAGSQNQLYSASIASGIRALPAPTAPKEPQR